MSLEGIPYLICWGIVRLTHWCRKYNGLKTKAKEYSKITPNHKQSRGHHSNSTMIYCKVLLLIALIFFLSGCKRNKSWLKLPKDEYSQDFILDGSYVRIGVLKFWRLWSCCFDILFNHIKYIVKSQMRQLLKIKPQICGVICLPSCQYSQFMRGISTIYFFFSWENNKKHEKRKYSKQSRNLLSQNKKPYLSIFSECSYF